MEATRNQMGVNFNLPRHRTTRLAKKHFSNTFLPFIVPPFLKTYGVRSRSSVLTDTYATFRDAGDKFLDGPTDASPLPLSSPPRCYDALVELGGTGRRDGLFRKLLVLSPFTGRSHDEGYFAI